jgi:multicomponent Na+:H+ antiporter subunit D
MAPIVILTGFVVWFGLFPESLIVMTQQAASGLSDPTAYIRSVFPEGVAP